MIMKQQGFNLRVLMSVALPFPLFLVAAVNGMEQQGRGGHGNNSNWSVTKETKLTEKLLTSKKEQDKRVKTANIVVALESKSDSESDFELESEELCLESLDGGEGYHFGLSLFNGNYHIVLGKKYFDP